MQQIVQICTPVTLTEMAEWNDSQAPPQDIMKVFAISSVLTEHIAPTLATHFFHLQIRTYAERGCQACKENSLQLSYARGGYTAV